MRILCLAKLSFEKKEEIKTFQINKNGDSVSSRPALSEFIKAVLQVKNERTQCSNTNSQLKNKEKRKGGREIGTF